MDGNIDKVREDIYEAISLLRKVRHGKKLLPISHCAIDRLDKALAALSAIDPEAIRREKAEEIYQAGFRQGKWFAMNTGPLKPVPNQPSMDESIDAILSAEPAQDECHDCIGRGWIIETDRHDMPVQAQCEACLGRGYINTKLAQADGKAEVPKVCGNCIHGKPTSLDDIRCYKATPYLPTGIHCIACADWEPCYRIANPRAAEVKRRIEEAKE